ncbi:MAG: cytochrome C biogenesis protein CcmF [Candidatus Pelagibacter sp.]|nr:cytochrome C biogenesis protein CcmF [Candidatus Pelagibacter sp.]OUV96774.1 MAG: cytochrome C biogenesis protein CcmF [Candidatus Pelagibacter sp. TMED142]
MTNIIGNLLIFFSLSSSFASVYFYFKKKFSLFLKSYLLSCLLCFSSFLFLIYCFVISDFSISAVYQNSHSTKPLIYKIAGSWGNHEGSMLLFVCIIAIYGSLFFYSSKNIETNFRNLTIFFQNILKIIFLLYLFFLSNPFDYIFSNPTEGLGLNPILQDPLLLIHPPFLYFGYIGFSLVLSLVLSGLIKNFFDKEWASLSKNWVIVSWVFLTIGILLGSIWAYYELGWGGYWFWDPVENASLMPWILSVALIHSMLIMEKNNTFKSWTALLAIFTFSLSLFGTFLVRSGILNSVHTFANDPERGLFILGIIIFIIFFSLLIFILKTNFTDEKKNVVFLSKENFLMYNNLFLIFFLLVVIIGTLYPIVLATFSNENISVGPFYYNTILAPFVFIFLFLMGTGPMMKWYKNEFKSKVSLIVSAGLISLILVLVSSYIPKKINIIYVLGLFFSFYLISATIYEIALCNTLIKIKQNLGRNLSHLGFGLLIMSITLNSFFSKEYNFMINLNEKFTSDDIEILFEDFKITKQSNFDQFSTKFKISKDKETIILRPSIRKYNQPEQLTSEISIKNTLLKDFYLAINYSSIGERRLIGARYYENFFILGIWISSLIIIFGGVSRLVFRK